MKNLKFKVHSPEHSLDFCSSTHPNENATLDDLYNPEFIKDEKQELLEEAKRRYPIGIKYTPLTTDRVCVADKEPYYYDSQSKLQDLDNLFNEFKEKYEQLRKEL